MSPKEEPAEEEQTDATTPQEQEEETNSNTSTEVQVHGTSDEQAQSDEQQRTYANLQPIFLAMEMGQEAAQQQEQEQASGAQIETTTTTAELTQQMQAFVTNAQSQMNAADQATGNQFVLTQSSQGSSMLLSNMVTAGAEGGTPVSLASILQDVVSGMQTSAGTVPAAIITDPTSSTGSFLIVNQNGVPIVRPVVVSNLQGGGTSVSAETLQVLASGVQDDHEAVAVEVATGQGEGKCLLLL